MMLFLRSLVANLYFYPAMALGFVVSLPVGVFSRPAMVAMWDKFLHPVIWSGMLKLCGITIEVRGKEYITPGVILPASMNRHLKLMPIPTSSRIRCLC